MGNFKMIRLEGKAKEYWFILNGNGFHFNFYIIKIHKYSI